MNALFLGLFRLLAGMPVANDSSHFVPDSVEIVRHNALEGSRALVSSDSVLYQWLQDALHWKTTEATVRRYLIVREGDTLDALRLSEAARLLRNQRFLADASIATRTDSVTGRRILRAETWDQWSLSLPVSISRAGGEISWIAGISEANLLGTGQSVGGYYASTPQRESWLLNYGNNAFGMPRGRLAFSAASSSDGFSGGFETGMPLRSRYDEFGVLLSGSYLRYTRTMNMPTSRQDQIQADYPGSWPTGECPWIILPNSEKQNLRLALTAASGEDVQLQGSVIGEWFRDSTGAVRVPSYMPEALRLSLSRLPDLSHWSHARPSRDDKRLGTQLVVKRVRYWSAKNFQNLKWTEDVPLGWSLESTLLWNLQSRGERHSAAWTRNALAWSLLPAKDWYLSNSGSAEWFLGGPNGPDQGLASARSEVRWFPAANLQTLGTASVDAALFQPESWTQYTLGEDGNLPGYAARSLAGKSRMLMTLEERWTPPIEALTVVPALAVFAGVGQVSSTSQPWEGTGWKAGFGFGLRFGMSRSIDGVVNHLSISRPVGGAPATSLKAWMVSFGSRQSL